MHTSQVKENKIVVNPVHCPNNWRDFFPLQHPIMDITKAMHPVISNIMCIRLLPPFTVYQSSDEIEQLSDAIGELAQAVDNLAQRANDGKSKNPVGDK